MPNPEALPSTVKCRARALSIATPNVGKTNHLSPVPVFEMGVPELSTVIGFNGASIVVLTVVYCSSHKVRNLQVELPSGVGYDRKSKEIFTLRSLYCVAR